MSSTSSSEESNVSSLTSVGQLSLDSVYFTSAGVIVDDKYDTGLVDDLDHIPHFMAEKEYSALPQEEQTALNESVCRIWSAFIATDYIVNGQQDCVNYAAQHKTTSTIQAGDGMLARVKEPLSIKGSIDGPDDKYRHLTKVSSSKECSQVMLTPGTTYIIHGVPEKVESYCLPH
eukprot:TRINITY_DN17_c1_g1_i1.p1 TRINITY_DN17_c1_g1~~TRINITY_DN17_c1_g1_i1.p1  ORF type:complete len:174 (+),score=16.73 TRINITY_DN17_c1_g1_i1:331-852(+)